MPSHRLGLVLHPDKDVAAELAVVWRWATEHDTEILARSRDRARVRAGTRAVPDEVFAADSDVLISLGGDGTMRSLWAGGLPVTIFCSLSQYI